MTGFPVPSREYGPGPWHEKQGPVSRLAANEPLALLGSTIVGWIEVADVVWLFNHI